ncbi:hypothetical protein FRC07_004869 [Ceratobasidium sp. 392]|nr:hypothetical protein FRC07_004869 [Ceratobasidium sp. 392]
MSEAVQKANESTDTERLSSISQVLGHRHVLVACGDSFVGPLTLLSRRRVYVKKFSGASAKALKAQLDDSDPPSPRSWGTTVLESYKTFIREDILPRRQATDSGYLRNIFVASIIMPCVNDENLDECIRKYRRREEEVAQTRDLRLIDCKVPTDIQTRRTMVQEVNTGLSTFCSGNGVRFVDINKHITTETGEVMPDVVDHDPTTIHVRWESTIGHWVEELAEAGLVEADISADIDATALQYEAEKKDRMQRRKVAADATLSPTLSDTVSIDDPGSPLILPQRSTTGWTRGRPSTPPPVSLVRSVQTSPESGPSWRGRSALGRIRGTSSPPRLNSRSTGFRFATVSGRSRAEEDDNWRSRSLPRRNSVPHVAFGAGLEAVFQSHHSSPVHTPPPTPLIGEFAQLDEPTTQDEESTQALEPSEEAS